MLPYPGLPQHLQVSIAPKQSSRGNMPFFRSCWSIVPTRVFKRDFVLPFLGVRVKSTSSRSKGGAGDDKKGGQFVIQEIFASSPLLEHSAAEGWAPRSMCDLMACVSTEPHLPPGNIVALVTAPSLSVEVLLDAMATSGWVNAPVSIQRIMMQCVVST